MVEDVPKGTAGACEPTLSSRIGRRRYGGLGVIRPKCPPRRDDTSDGQVVTHSGAVLYEIKSHYLLHLSQHVRVSLVVPARRALHEGYLSLNVAVHRWPGFNSRTRKMTFLSPCW